MVSRVPGVARTSLRRLGSKETVPPRARMRAAAASTRSTIAGVDIDEPMTWRWSAVSIRRSAASVGPVAPAALWRMLKTKSREPSAR